MLIQKYPYWQAEDGKREPLRNSGSFTVRIGSQSFLWAVCHRIR